MDTTVAVHRAASMLALVMLASAVLSKDDPQVLTLLVMIGTEPLMTASVLLMAALAMPETTERRN